MLTKCANPKCNARFRYLHEGKLFIVDRCNRPARSDCAEPVSDGQTNDRLDYYWLCTSCSRSMIVVSGQSAQAQVLPATLANPDREFI